MEYDVVAKANEFSRDFEVDPHIDGDMDLLAKALEFIDEEVKETNAAVQQNDAAEIVDGFGDVAFIAINGIYKFFRLQGDDHEKASVRTKEVLTRICKANLGKKHADGTIKYLNGKVQKPEGWQPPQYEDMVA